MRVSELIYTEKTLYTCERTHLYWEKNSMRVSELIYTEKKLYACERTRLNWEKTLCVRTHLYWEKTLCVRANSFILRKNSMRVSEVRSHLYSEKKLYAWERTLIYTRVRSHA